MKKYLDKFLVFTFTFLLLVFLNLYLRFLGFGALIKLLKKPRKNIFHINKLGYVSKSIKLICSVFPNITCLVRASILRVIFNKTENLKIIIGITNNQDKFFESHAWVTFNENIILNNDLKISSYKIIYTI